MGSSKALQMKFMTENKNWLEHLGIQIHFELNSQILSRVFSIPSAYLKSYFPVVAVNVSLQTNSYKLYKVIKSVQVLAWLYSKHVNHIQK